MNDIFSFSRFVKYAKAQVILQRRLLLLLISGGFIALLLITLFSLSTIHGWKNAEWTAMFLTSGAIGALLLAGNAFPFLRKKETCQNTLMIPASTFEKFTYEFVLKIILFTLLYPILFKLMASTVLPLAQFISPERTFLPFSFDPIIYLNEEYLLPSLALGYLFAISLAFAGASALRRYPLIKTVVFIGILILLAIGYLYFIFEKLNLHKGMEYVVKSVISNDNEGFTWLFLFLGISSITSFTYAFFKLKEREV